MKIIKILYLLVVTLFCTSLIYADKEYNFKLEINQDLDDDEELECTLKYDSKTKNYDFDENDRSSDMEFEYQFDDDVELECDSDVEGIDFTVYDLEDNKVYETNLKNTDYFYYELELYEGFINIEHDLEGNNDEIIECTLNLDGTDEEFIYENVSDIDEEIEFEFLEEMEFECNERIDSMRIEIEDPNGFEVFERDIEDEDSIKFDQDTPIVKYNVYLFFKYDFDDDTTCEITLDDEYEYEVEYDDSESASKRQLDYNFGEKFELRCDEEFNEVNLDIEEIREEDTIFSQDYFNSRNILILEEDILNFVEEEEEIVEEKEVIVEEEEEEIVEEIIVNEESSQNNNNNNNLNLEKNTSQIKVNQSLNLSQDISVEPLENNEIYTFIGIISFILVVAIVIFFLKL